jgi:choline dehydrogenase-like flavoprotein
MEIADLAGFDVGTRFETDLVIVGGGPAALTIAKEFIGTSTRVLILESGLLDETADHAALAEIESCGEPKTDVQKQKRSAFHGASASRWSEHLQPFGVRCRALGGSTHAWAGKSAAFDGVDFAKRSWVPFSGWPFERQTLDAFLDRAARVLNLGPNLYDDKLWELLGTTRPQPELDTEGLSSFFWQFARSRIDQFDIMRFGREFVTFKADNVRVLLNATATRIDLTADGCKFDGLEVSTLLGARHRLKARVAVVATGAIENARLLLASNHVQSQGVGNGFGLVGRFLMDHAVARVGSFQLDDLAPIIRRFGFYGLRHGGRTHMYMHGLAPTPLIQEREQLLNSAIYFMPDRSPDDPWDALKRLMRRASSDPIRDLRSVISGAGLLTKGIGLKALSNNTTPSIVRKLIVDATIQYFPNVVVEEFQSRGLPHKLTGVSIDVISEQRPDPDSRIVLSQRTDRLGVPLARAHWRINNDERRTIVKLAHLARDAFGRTGLPQPILEPWVAEGRVEDCEIIDFGHTSGTTRMSDDPRSGVVDVNSQVHGVSGLYIAGASVFPTSGHANPTLMILALAIRLADKIKSEIAWTALIE